jgi:CRP/FNR family transcriptional regulator, cyclic AMP receptor protein
MGDRATRERSLAPTAKRGRMGHDPCVRFVKDLVRVFELDPDLLAGQDERSAAHLRVCMVAQRIWAEPGPWQPERDAGSLPDGLGLLVLDGLLVRTTQVSLHTCAEIVGPGDLLAPSDGEPLAGSLGCASRWRVLQPTMLAALDGAFAARIACSPGITAAMLERGMRRSRALAHQTAIAGIRDAQTRVLLSLWHLADRWGRVTPDGVVLALPLTHQLLAQVTCLRRPTVSSALGQLARAGRLSRLPGSGWLLYGQPPTMPPTVPAAATTSVRPHATPPSNERR